MQCDFLNALAFDCAAANCHHPLLLSIYARVKAAVAQHSKPLRIVRVHHPGHQRDESWCAYVQRSRRCDHPSSQRIVLMHRPQVHHAQCVRRRARLPGAAGYGDCPPQRAAGAWVWWRCGQVTLGCCSSVSKLDFRFIFAGARQRSRSSACREYCSIQHANAGELLADTQRHNHDIECDWPNQLAAARPRAAVRVRSVDAARCGSRDSGVKHSLGGVMALLQVQAA